VKPLARFAGLLTDSSPHDQSALWRPASARRNVVPLATLLAATAVLFWPNLVWLARSWSANPYYSHGFLIPALAAWLLWRQRHRLGDSQPSVRGAAVLGAGVVAHVWAWPRQAQLVSMAGLLLALVGVSHLMAGRVGVRVARFPVLLLAVSVPVPWIEQVIPRLESLVAGLSTLCVRQLGVEASHTGAQVQLSDTAFVVGAPCSGLRSLVALLTLALLWAHLARGPWWGRAGLLLSAVPIAVASNLLRVTGLLWVADAFGPRIGLGFYHTVASPVVFVAAVVLMAVVGRGLHCDVRL
jgi:exosortase